MGLIASSTLALASAACFAAFWSAPVAGAAPAPQGPDFDLEPMGNAVPQATALAFAPGVTDRVFVAERAGRVWAVIDGVPSATPFLDISARVTSIGECGLIGLVFDPEFQANRFVYLTYTDPTIGSGEGDTKVSRFSVPAGSLAAADPASETIIFGPLLANSNAHKGGDLEFGPDGMLYVALGDGGSGFFSNSEVAQDLGNANGKILRLDVRLPFPHVPADNPFVNTPGALPEIWMSGLRNPFRIGIDALTGDLYVSDVGQSAEEEVNFAPAGVGGLNAGWPCMEGDQCYPSSACVCFDPVLLDPVLSFSHGVPDSFCSIMGGVVARGSGIPSLEGKYIFHDYCTGQFKALDMSSTPPTLEDLSGDITDIGAPIRFVTDFTQAEDGSIWFCEQFSGRLWRIAPKTGIALYCQATVNSSGEAARIGASGSRSLSAGDMTFTVEGLPVGQFGFFNVSESRFFLQGLGGGDGNLCLGQPLYRWNFEIKQSGPQGEVELVSDLTNLPFGVQPTAGETWHFQYWTRDFTLNPPSNTSNTSNAVSVTFTP